MSEQQESPYIIRLDGRVDGKPHSIDMDVRQVVADRARIHGVSMTDDELDAESAVVYENIQKTKEALAKKPTDRPPLPGILRRILNQ